MLIDIVMPELGGREASEGLRLLDPDARILFTSGSTERMLSHGGELTPVLKKPYEPDRLLRMVRDLLGRVRDSPVHAVELGDYLHVLGVRKWLGKRQSPSRSVDVSRRTAASSRNERENATDTHREGVKRAPCQLVAHHRIESFTRRINHHYFCLSYERDGLRRRTMNDAHAIALRFGNGVNAEPEATQRVRADFVEGDASTPTLHQAEADGTDARVQLGDASAFRHGRVHVSTMASAR